MCMSTTSSNPFTVTDSDGDAISFIVNSSNTLLLPNAAIAVSNISGSNYQATYTPIVGQTGSSTITITANDGFGGSTIYTFILNVTAAPAVSVSASATAVCQGQSVTLSGVGASTYSWTGGITNGVAFVPSSTTTYTVTGTISGCGTNTSTQTITVNPIPSVTANASSATICPGGSVTLTGGGATSYSWTSGVTNGISFVPLSTSTYTVTGTSLGCTNTASVTVTISARISVSASASATNICSGESVVLTGGGATSYSWTGGVTDGIAFIPSGTTTYTVTGTSGSCTNTATQVITVNASVNVGVTQVANVLTASSTTATYQWIDCNNSFALIPSETNQSFTPAIDGSYAVIVNEAGCVDTSACYLIMTTAITILDKINLEVYPNPTNGIIYFNLENSSSAKIEIYNSLGQLIISKEVTSNQNHVDFSNQENGIYMVKIIVGDKIKMKSVALTN